MYDEGGGSREGLVVGCFELRVTCTTFAPWQRDDSDLRRGR